MFILDVGVVFAKLKDLPYIVPVCLDERIKVVW